MSLSSRTVLDSKTLPSILRSCIHFGNTLIQMFGSCGGVDQAEAAFNRIEKRNLLSWKIMLTAYAQTGHMSLAARLFELMPGRDVAAFTAMITGHGRSGELDLCESFFREIRHRESCGVVSWNAMIAAYALNGHCSEAASMGKLMLLDGIRPNKSTVVRILELPSSRIDDATVKIFGRLIEESELQFDASVGACLLRAHGRSGDVAEARVAFDRIRGDDTLVAGNSMLWAYARNGCLAEAGEFFETMAKRDVVSWTTLLSGWIQRHRGGDHHFRRLRDLFDRMPQWNVVSWNTMVAGLASTGEMDAAEEMFERAGGEIRDVVTWNSMIAGYARSGSGSFARAIRLLGQMDLEGEPPNRVTWITLLDCCSDLRLGKLLHDQLEQELDSDADLSCLLVGMYGRSGNLEDACKSFDRVRSSRDSVRAWTALIGAFAANSANRRSIEAFRKMILEGVQPDKVAMVSILDACSAAGDLESGELLHRCSAERNWQTDLLVGTAMLNMYVKCGRFELSKMIFDAMPEKSLVSWTSMVSSYAQSGLLHAAIRAFKLMDLDGFDADGVALACILDACADSAALSDGRTVLASFESSGKKLDHNAGAAAINLFGKCGDVSRAAAILSRFETWEWSLALCTTMVAAFARNGHGQRARKVFELMELQGLEMDTVSFTTILSACSAAGLLRDGRYYFVSMRGDYLLPAAMDHYVCMIDLLARAGRVDEGFALLENMPFEPDGVSWVTVLSSCKTHGDFDVASNLTARVPASEADHPAALVTFFNLVAESSS